LIDPFSKNESTCENLEIQFFLKQKKRFSFRKWEKEIGGDMCVSYDVSLRGKKYAVFLNADAMGKSIQGAGGALVIGSGLKAIIERNKFSSFDQNHYPELWLKNSVMELQSVFKSFDCSMLISVVFGLIDNETGVVYFINAEHPWNVLYKNGKAEFIESELSMRKLGIEQEDNPIRIKVFKLNKDDKLIAGSDGRDDILIPDKVSDELVINEDENLFLKHVEEGQGKLEQIFKAISNKGKLTDDLSMLSIHYHGDSQTSLNPEEKEIVGQVNELRMKGDMEGAIRRFEEKNIAESNNPEMLREYIKLLVNDIKDYEKVSDIIERYLEKRPDDTNLLYVSSVSLSKIRKYKRATLHAERVYLREPDNLKYILQLAKTNIMIENFIEADKLLDMLLRKDPENKAALKLKETL
jgi:tetratricopeptide (TPR) repeat protein